MRFAVLVPVLSLAIAGCTSSSSDDPAATTEWKLAVQACELEDDATVTPEVDIRACDPANAKKTTICHVPPGNPDNAHTLCVGNAAVRAHVDHGDSIGACVSEQPCMPPVDGGDGGVDGGDGGGSGSGSDGGGGVIL